MNVVIYDWPATDDVEFTQGLVKSTHEEWHSIGMENSINKTKKFLGSLMLICNIFLHRNEYSRIVCWQQLHGLLFASLCKFFHVRKRIDLTIMTLIYKPKTGIAGKLWRKFYEFSLKNKYVDRIICFSEFECEYYSKLFDISLDKFKWTTFGVADEMDRFEITSKLPNNGGGYLLDVGRSNRDHNFLIDALDGSNYIAKIVDRTFNANNTKNCEVIRNVTWSDELYQLIANAFVVVVPLKDAHISSGQTVFIQAMMFGKPIIVTETDTLSHYIEDKKNGLIISKSQDELLVAIKALIDDSKMYSEMCQYARKKYEQVFTITAFGENVGSLLAT